MELRHHNFTLDGSDIPLFAGDRWYGQDILRDFYNNKEYSANILEDLLANYSDNMVVYGVNPSQGAGHTLSWTVGRIKTTHTLKTPTNWASLPPGMTSHTIPYVLDLPAASNQAITSAVTDGATINYAKISFLESATSSRTRAKKAGSYNSEVSESYTFTCDDSAPASNETTIATFITDGTTITFLNTETRWKLERNNSKKNFIINPDGMIIQRGSSFTAATDPANNDDTYLLDRWLLLSDGNDIVDVSRSTDAPSGATYSMKSLVATANKKWGFLQIIENREAIDLFARSASLGFAIKTTAGNAVKNIRAAILSWDGAVDTVTSDVVSAWNAAGTNPTLVANWTYENTPSNISLYSDWAIHWIENIDIDTASVANIALFIWVDDTDAAVNDELYISQIQLVEGNEICKYMQRYFTQEIILSKRFYQKSYNFETTPATVTDDGEYILYYDGLSNAAHTVKGIVFLPVVSRTNSYTITTYDNVPTKDKITTSAGNGQNPTFERKSDISFSVSGTNGGASTQAKLEFQWVIDDEL